MDNYLAKVKKPKYISDELIKTIDLIAQARDSELSFDKTIIAEVVSLNNAETGEYYVSYQQGKFKAYTPTNLNYVYNEGVNVYVKIPGGDFSAKKLIEGKASAATITEEEYDFMASNVIEMGYGFQDTDKTYSVLAGAGEKDKYYESVIYENLTNKEDATFVSTFLAYPTIKISADFKTDFKGDPTSGNYGLKVEFYTDKENENITYTRKLEIANFVGSLHQYLVFSPQYAIYKVENIKLTAVKKITLFQERYSEYDNLKDNEGNIIYENKTEPNIFVKNIKISFVDNIDNTDSLYYCGIQAVQGLSLAQDTDTITLEGKFYYALKDVLSPSNCQCYWFKQNPVVVPGHELYNQYAGGGWEEIIDNKVNYNVLTLRGSDVYQQMRIKLVIIYNNTMTFSNEVRVVKYFNSRFAINKVSDATGTFLELIDAQDKIETADWYVRLPDGSYYQYASGANQINVSEFLYYPEVSFQTAIKLDDNTIVPYDYELKNALIDTDIRVFYSGIDTFLYDVNGDITYTDYDKEMVITPIINTNASTVVTGVTWFGPSGARIFEAKQSPEDSMMRNIRVNAATNAVHFSINPKFYSNRNLNTLQLKIETSTGSTYYFNKTINFIKEGSQGANGLTYTMIVNYSDDKGQEYGKSIPLTYKKKTWGKVYLHPKIFVDGKTIYNNTKIDDNRYYKISYVVQSINVKTTSIGLSNKNDSLFAVTGNDELNDQGQYFVRFVTTIKVMNNDKEESSHIINYYQPILIAYGDINIDDLTAIKIPNLVTYTANGDTPSYSSEYISVIYKGVEQVSLAKPQSLNDNIFISYLNHSNGSIDYYIYPAQIYKGANFPIDESGETMIPMGAIKIKISSVSESYLIQPVAMLLATDMNKNIDGYNGGVITIIDDKNIEKTKLINSVVGTGSINGVNEVFSNGMLFGTEIMSAISGLFGFDADGTPTNTIKSDGSFSLGNGAINMSYDENGKQQFSASDAFTEFLKSILT